MTAEERVCWVVAPCGWITSSQNFEKNVPPFSSGLSVNLRTRNRADEGGTHSFKKSETNYQTGRNIPEDLLPQYENGFAIDKIF
jgi:hypothetical protein